MDLVPVSDGWVTLSLTEAELWSLYRVACLAREDLEEALRAAASRMNRVLSGGPALPDPERRLAEPALVLDEVDIPLTAADRVFLRSHPEWLEDLPSALARRMIGEGSRPVRVLVGEALLLEDHLGETGMDPEVSEADAGTLFDLMHRIKAALGRVSRRASHSTTGRPQAYSPPVPVGFHQRIPVALRPSELEYLGGRPDLLPSRAAGLLRADVQLSGPRLLLTLDEVDVLLSRSAELEETELLQGLERRLDQVLRSFAAE